MTVSGNGGDDVDNDGDGGGADCLTFYHSFRLKPCCLRLFLSCVS